jgi:hypothetical protein
MSCACRLADPSGTLEHPDGGLLCREIKDMPHAREPGSSYRKEHWRCEGQNCRELAYAPSRIAFMEPVMRFATVAGRDGGGFCPPEFPECSYFAHWGLWFLLTETGDGLYSFAMAFECMERKGQLVEFIESDYSDEAMRSSLVDCLRSVSFEGMGGRISYTHLQGPPPGHTYSGLAQTDDAFHSACGSILPDKALLYNKFISRESLFACEDWTSAYGPGRDCHGTSIDYFLDQGNSEVFPLGSPTHCSPGEYPISIGENVEGLR